MKRREANFELLRIIAMLMIISLHYLDKGGILPKPQEEFTGIGSIAWGLEAFCVSAVNVYVLLSAYFLAAQEWKPERVLRLWAEVLFYSVGILLVLTATGIVPVTGLDLYQIMNYIFPVVEEHYWFVTAYVLMYLLAPLMNRTLRELPERTLRRGILLLLLLLSVSKSILPVKLPTDRMGYDALWFLCLYLIGAYIRYHGAGKKQPGAIICFAGYAACSLLIFASLLMVREVYQRTGSLGDFISRQYQYNSILCLAASVFLLLLFGKLTILEGRLAGGIRRMASASFGVYLIHEHLNLRYLWPEWIGVQHFADTPLFVLHWIVGILLVYGVCMVVDFGRQALFYRIGVIAEAWIQRTEKRK